MPNIKNVHIPSLSCYCRKSGHFIVFERFYLLFSGIFQPISIYSSTFDIIKANNAAEHQKVVSFTAELSPSKKFNVLRGFSHFSLEVNLIYVSNENHKFNIAASIRGFTNRRSCNKKSGWFRYFFSLIEAQRSAQHVLRNLERKLIASAHGRFTGEHHKIGLNWNLKIWTLGRHLKSKHSFLLTSSATCSRPNFAHADVLHIMNYK